MKKPIPSPTRRRLPDGPGTVRIPVQVPTRLHERVSVVEAKLNWSVAELIREAAANFCDVYEAAAKKGGAR